MTVVWPDGTASDEVTLPAVAMLESEVVDAVTPPLPAVAMLVREAEDTVCEATEGTATEVGNVADVITPGGAIPLNAFKKLADAMIGFLSSP